MKIIAITLITVLAFFTACSSDDDNQVQSKSRTLRYELTGNFSGSNSIAAYTTASGGTVIEQITTLPWSKEITFDSGVAGANLVVSGAGGSLGQQVTMLIKRGGNTLGTPITATVDMAGSFTISSPVIIF